MWLCRNSQKQVPKVVIQQLQREIQLLQQRLARLEQRKAGERQEKDEEIHSFSQDLSSLEECISVDQIPSSYKDIFKGPNHMSFSAPSIESISNGLKDPLSQLSSLHVYDEPVYDEYDDDIVLGVLDVDKPLHDDDQSEPDVQHELFTPSVHNKATNSIAISDKKIAIQDLPNWLDIEASIYFSRMLKETQMNPNDFTITNVPSTCVKLEMLKIGRQVDIGWTYPDRFSQPNPPPYCGQSNIFLQA